MFNKARKVRQNMRKRLVKSKRRRYEVVLTTQVTNNINHAQFANTCTRASAGKDGFLVVRTVPHAHKAILGGLESSQGVSHGGRERKWLQGRLSKAEVRHLM